MITRMVAAIPKTNASLAASGFGATPPSLHRLEGRIRERCVSYFTLRWDIIPHPRRGLVAGWADQCKGNVGVEKAPPLGQRGFQSHSSRGRIPASAPKQIQNAGDGSLDKKRPRRSGAKCACGRKGLGLPRLGNSESGGWFPDGEHLPPECCRRATGVRSQRRVVLAMTGRPAGRWQVPARRLTPAGRGAWIIPLLGRSALQLIEDQFAMLLECDEALFERIEH